MADHQTFDVLLVVLAQPDSYTAGLHPGDDGAVAVAAPSGSGPTGAPVVITATADQTDHADQAGQAWAFTPVGSDYHIVNAAAGQCLTTDGTPGNPIYLSPCGDDAGQLWQPSGDYGGESCSWLRNPASDLFLHWDADRPTVIDTARWDGGTRAESFFPTALRSTSASASEKPASTCAIRITCSW